MTIICNWNLNILTKKKCQYFFMVSFRSTTWNELVVDKDPFIKHDQQNLPHPFLLIQHLMR
jgi:hypothetical protein